MIRFQTQRTKSPTRSAVGRRGRINTVALGASVALIARLVSACSGLPATSAVSAYPDLNDIPPRAEVSADQVAKTKAELIQLRDDQVRAVALQLALH